MLPKSRRRGCGTHDGHRVWLNTDPCGIIMGSLVYVIVGFCDFAIMTGLIYPWLGFSFWGALHAIVWNTLAALAIVSHLRAMFSNPGAVPVHSKPTNPAFYSTECYKCNNFKPPRAHHCSACNRCIIKMDHHCPWINNCVGLANQKYFLLFLVYIFSISIYALVLMVARLVMCTDSWASSAKGVVAAARALRGAAGPVAVEAGGMLTFANAQPTAGVAQAAVSSGCSPWTPAQAGLVLAVAVIAVLFALFTGCLFGDQLTSVLSGETAIDRYKHGHSHARPTNVWASLAEVFGGDPETHGWQWSWLLPTPIVYRDPEALTGFCFRDVARPRTLTEEENA